MGTQVTAATIPYGDAGSRATLGKMRGVVLSAIRLPIVVEQAHAIARYTAPRDYHAIAIAIRDWMAQAFKFVADPIGVELVRTPDYMLRQFNIQSWISGDCDDAAVLGAALGMAVGIPAKFIAIGFASPTGQLAHVFTVLFPRNGTPVSLDITRPAGVVAQVRRRLVFVV